MLRQSFQLRGAKLMATSHFLETVHALRISLRGSVACDNSCSKFEGIVDIGFGDSLGTFEIHLIKHSNLIRLSLKTSYFGGESVEIPGPTLPGRHSDTPTH